jgi:hypothetical protein
VRGRRALASGKRVESSWLGGDAPDVVKELWAEVALGLKKDRRDVRVDFDGGLEVVAGISKTRHSYQNDTKLYHSIGVLPS